MHIFKPIFYLRTNRNNILVEEKLAKFTIWTASIILKIYWKIKFRDIIQIESNISKSKS